MTTESETEKLRQPLSIVEAALSDVQLQNAELRVANEYLLALALSKVERGDVPDGYTELVGRLLAANEQIAHLKSRLRGGEEETEGERAEHIRSASETAILKGVELFDVVHALTSQGASGVAIVVDGERCGSFVVRKGQLCYAFANTRPRLGEILIERGVLSEAELTQALKGQDKLEEREPMGTLLVEMGLVDEDVVAAETKRHLQETFHELLGWQAASLHFRAQDVDNVSAILENGINAQTLLLQFSVLRDHLGRSESTTPGGAPVDRSAVSSE